MDGYSNEGQRIASVFCNRMAPVQMAYFVYIGSLGSPFVDYIITDPVASPPSSSGLSSTPSVYANNRLQARGGGRP